MGDNLPSLEISFDSPLKVFMPGESITGTVKLIAKDDVSIEIIAVFFRGEHYFYRGDDEVSRIFTAASCKMDLEGAGEGNAQLPFSFVVRPDMPASIATPLGGIRYHLYATHFNRVLNEVEKSEYFTIIVPKQIRDSLSGKKESVRERGLLSCCLGYIAADLEVDRTSLLCGHCAVVNVCVVNATNSHVLMTSLSLVQKVERFKDGRVIKNKVATKERGSIMPGKRQVWLAEKILIPPLPPSGSYLYYYVSYNFILEIQKSIAQTVKVKVPVIIGNIPQDWKTPPSTWNNNAAGLEFWCSSIEDSTKEVGFRPLYVSHVTV